MTADRRPRPGRAGGLGRRALVACMCACGIVLAAMAHGAVIERGKLLGTGSTAVIEPGEAASRQALSPHVWWVTTKDGITTFQHLSADAVPDGGAPHYDEVLRLGDAPEGITANDDRVWAVFPPTAIRPHARDVLTFATRRSPATGIAFADPPTGTLLASLPAGGELVGFTSDSKGPWALLQGAPATRFGVRRNGQAHADAMPYRLVRLVGEEWTAIELPEGFATAPSLRLTNIDGAIAVIAPAQRLHAPASTSTRSRVARRIADAWRLATLDVPSTGVSWFHAAGRPAVAWNENSRLQIAYLREEPGDEGGLTLLPWASMAVPASPWLLAGDRNGAVMVIAGEPIAIRRLSPLESHAGPLTALEKPGFSSGAWIHLPLLGAIVLAALLAYSLSRSLSGASETEAREAPTGLPLERRALALAIDLLPGAALSIFLLGASPGQLLILPAWSFDRSASEPAVLAALVACLHGGVLEAIVGASIGKLLVGGRVVAIDGSKLGVARTAVRSVLKFVTLCAPILLLFVLLDPRRRSIGDSLARAIVIDIRARPGDAAPPER